MARIAYARNLPKRFSRKSDRCSAESTGSALQIGSTTTKSSAAAPTAAASRLGTAAPRGEQSGRTALQKQHHEHENGDLGEHRAERGLDALVEPANPRRCQNRSRELADT